MTAFMRDMEERFQRATGLKGRSEYQIYYCRVPQDISIGDLFENDEHDVLDCSWKENTGLMKLLLPLFSNDAGCIRREVVKTNLAFQRTEHLTREQPSFEAICAPYLEELLAIVRPKLVLLTGADLSGFASRFGTDRTMIGEPVRNSAIGHTVFASARVRLRALGQDSIAVQLAHASQFSWTYKRYGVIDKIRDLLRDSGLR